jgi:hypothetical protein
MQLLWLISRWYKEKGSVPNAAAVWKQKPSESDTDDYRRMFGVMDGRDVEGDWTPDKEHLGLGTRWLRCLRSSRQSCSDYAHTIAQKRGEEMVGREARTFS